MLCFSVQGCLIFFTFELCLHIIAEGLYEFLNGPEVKKGLGFREGEKLWNRFDILLVLAGWAGQIVRLFLNISTGDNFISTLAKLPTLRVLRALRALRILRIIKKKKKLMRVTMGLMYALPG